MRSRANPTRWGIAFGLLVLALLAAALAAPGCTTTGTKRSAEYFPNGKMKRRDFAASFTNVRSDAPAQAMQTLSDAADAGGLPIETIAASMGGLALADAVHRIRGSFQRRAETKKTQIIAEHTASLRPAPAAPYKRS